MNAQPPTKDVVIGKYVALRDEIKVIAERHAAELAPYQDQMDRIESWLLANLNQDGVDSYKTQAGTAYKTTSMSARLEDRALFMDSLTRNIAVKLMERLGIPHDKWVGQDGIGVKVMAAIIEADWSLVDVRVAKTGVKEFMDEHKGSVPLGVVVEHVTKVNVRRS